MTSAPIEDTKRDQELLNSASGPRCRIAGCHVPQVLFRPRLQRLHGARASHGRERERERERYIYIYLYYIILFVYVIYYIKAKPRWALKRAFAKVTDSSTFNSEARRSRAPRRCPEPGSARSVGSQSVGCDVTAANERENACCRRRLTKFVRGLQTEVAGLTRL